MSATVLPSGQNSTTNLHHRKVASKDSIKIFSTGKKAPDSNRSKKAPDSYRSKKALDSHRNKVVKSKSPTTLSSKKNSAVKKIGNKSPNFVK